MSQFAFLQREWEAVFEAAAGAERAVHADPRTARIELVNLVVDHLTEHGVVTPGLLYESPSTDLAPRGPESSFDSEQLDGLLRALDALRATASAA